MKITNICIIKERSLIRKQTWSRFLHIAMKNIFKDFINHTC